MKPAYWQMLKDPRWQKRRLEIMQRDHFSCLECGASDRTLNIHHLYYVKGRAPWEYDDEALVCLCEACHEHVERDAAELRRLFCSTFWAGRHNILGYARTSAAVAFAGPMRIKVDDRAVAAGIASFFKLSVNDVLERVESGSVDVESLWELAQFRGASAVSAQEAE